MPMPVIIRGGGDLASGVVMRLYRAGIRLVIAELKQPLAVRRTVSFAQAIYAGAIEIEGVHAKRAQSLNEAEEISSQGDIPVLVEPNLEILVAGRPLALVDARMAKREPETTPTSAQFVIGLGPGYVAGTHSHAVVETLRGHNLGRVYWEGPAAMNTGLPGSIVSYNVDRVLRAPANGFLEPRAEIGQRLKRGDLIATIHGQEVRALFDGVLRGLIHPSVELTQGMKIGDLDPRDDPSFCYRVSDKALAVGGGVLEALLTRPEIRSRLWL
ncbi:MAG: selenium-dependent molybdenum cofactor biosynthesis protein YqeB [Chloroflexi bacterium]|nr:selenium-dependent molybdenum cofactor biosynthesis protein YqeB [Chloroflexota bacterium]